MDLKETDILGDRIGEHWYYRSKAQAMSRLLSAAGTAKTVLDVGVGSGFFSKYLLDHTSADTAWCVDISYGADSDASHDGKSIHYRRAIESVDADVVLLMDVLEHVDDDIGLLGHYVEKVPSGTRFLITVPAFQFLWSEHDVFLEHRRRYTLAQIDEVVRANSLELVRSAYYFGAILPLAAALRMGRGRKAPTEARSQLSLHHPLVNRALTALCRAELPFFEHNRWGGLSAFVLARKP